MAERFVVSARKYRPATFGELVGQEAIAATLQRSIRQGKIAHAYLFCGPRGVGKTSAARIFAKTINCLHLTPEGEACGECEACRAFEQKKSLSVYELDAASNNSTDDVRRLIDEVSVPPQTGKHKVYIIDEVHMLSKQAFNAFLKTLEEPPSYVVFILATTEKQMILPTILSRCQVYDFRPIPEETIVKQLQYVAFSEHIPAEEDALAVIARSADGGMRDALSLFDRIAGFGGGSVTYKQTVESLHILDKETFFRIASCMHQGDSAQLLQILDGIYAEGFDGKAIISGLSAFFRTLYLAADEETLPLAKLDGTEKTNYVTLARAFGKFALYACIMKLMDCERQYRTASGKRLLVEMTLIGIALSKEMKDQRATVAPPVQTPQVQQATQTAQAAPKPQPTDAAPRPVAGNAPTQPSAEQRTPIRNPLRSGVVTLRPQAAEKAPAAAEKPTGPLSLMEAWAAYRARTAYNDPAKRFITSLFPTLHEGNIVHFVVRDQAQQAVLQAEQQYILPSLSNAMQKPLSMQVEIAKAEPGGGFHNPKQWLKDEIEQNPYLKQLFEEFNLRER